MIAKPDIIINFGRKRVAVEVKYWRFDGEITGQHVRNKVANKNWKQYAVRLFLSVIPKQLSDEARCLLRQDGIRHVNGLDKLMGVLQNCLGGETGGWFLPQSDSGIKQPTPVFCEKLCGHRASVLLTYPGEGSERGHYVCVEHANVANVNKPLVIERTPAKTLAGEAS